MNQILISLGIENEVVVNDAFLSDEEVNSGIAESVVEMEVIDQEIESSSTELVNLQNDTHTLSEINTVISESSQISEESYKIAYLALESIYARYGIPINEAIPSVESFSFNPTDIITISQEKIGQTLVGFGKAVKKKVRDIIRAIIDFFKRVFSKLAKFLRIKSKKAKEENKKTTAPAEERAKDPDVQETLTFVKDRNEQGDDSVVLTDRAKKIMEELNKDKERIKKRDEQDKKDEETVDKIMKERERERNAEYARKNAIPVDIQLTAHEANALLYMETAKPYTTDRILEELTYVREKTVTCFSESVNYFQNLFNDKNDVLGNDKQVVKETMRKLQDDLFKRHLDVVKLHGVTSEVNSYYFGFNSWMNDVGRPSDMSFDTKSGQNRFTSTIKDFETDSSSRDKILDALDVTLTKMDTFSKLSSLNLWKKMDEDQDGVKLTTQIALGFLHVYYGLAKHLSVAFKGINRIMVGQIKIDMLKDLVFYN